MEEEEKIVIYKTRNYKSDEKNRNRGKMSGYLKYNREESIDTVSSDGGDTVVEDRCRGEKYKGKNDCVFEKNEKDEDLDRSVVDAGYGNNITVMMEEDGSGSCDESKRVEDEKKK